MSFREGVRTYSISGGCYPIFGYGEKQAELACFSPTRKDTVKTSKIEVSKKNRKRSSKRKFMTYSNQDGNRPNRNTAALQSFRSEEQLFRKSRIGLLTSCLSVVPRHVWFFARVGLNFARTFEQPIKQGWGFQFSIPFTERRRENG